MRIGITATVSVVLASVCCGANDREARKLDTYFLISDKYLLRRASAPVAQIFYTANQKLIEGKLADFGQKFPDNIDIPQGALFVLVISDHVREAFGGLSIIDSRHEVVVALTADKEAKPPKDAEKDKKAQRLLLLATAPLNGIERIAIKTADGALDENKSESLGR